MIERLDQLTLQNLIDLSCGDRSVLLVGDEKPDEADIMERAGKILDEYKSIASPNQAKMDMIEAEEMTKFRMKEKCLRICLALCCQGRPDMARNVLLELDVSPGHIDTDENVLKRCKAMLDEVVYEIKRHEELKRENGDKAVSEAEARKSWYAEIAFVMSSLKMSIDPATVNAAVYANLVNVARERNKALAKMPPSLGMFL